MNTPLFSAHYFPCVDYFLALPREGVVQLEKHEWFDKQTYRNRCYIGTANGIFPLIVPLRHAGKQTVSEIQLDYTQHWQNQHWRTLVSAYRNSPYFDFLADDIRTMLYTKYDSLFAMNFSLLKNLLKLMKWKTDLHVTDVYQESSAMDFRKKITLLTHPPDSGNHTPYQQVFEKKFVSNLSVLDYLFCVGKLPSNETQR